MANRWIAFTQFDIHKLRVELISIYTVDSLRRVVTESLVPFLLQVRGLVTD